ncbi:MAG: molybdenum cofactor biosynthesis protein MoaE [Archangium sp.]|nr:molybdenum cofactor biosynthesis protein MoaE [Archangium sp.]MDP3156431.1 molybdenum cofactor biosynthesis protein MoaE [Archangium sp.]MDP3573123.1 molybdenum cofactor biosynthesis protein MoaE [Archangium sp.]
MKTTVRFFAAARERAKRTTLELDLPAGSTVADLTKKLLQELPELAPLLPKLRIAVAEEFAAPEDLIPEGAEVALIPPVAGGSGGLFRLQDTPLSLQEAIDAVASVSQGGLVTFSGAVRDHSKGKRVTRLDYEAYGPMAQKKLAQIGAEAREKWPGTQVAVLHRLGTLVPGELAVVIAVSAPHRKEAFRACEYVIDRLKEDVPIWKKEFAEDGEVWVGLGP